MRCRSLLLCVLVLLVLQPVPAGAVGEVYQRPGRNELISVSTDGVQPDSDSLFAGMTPDARLVVFASKSPDVVSNDTNDEDDIFIRDREAGTTTLVSVAADGGPTNGQSMQPAISANGRYVVFLSYATNLVGDPAETPSVRRVYVRDLQTQTTERVIHAFNGGPPNDDTLQPSISGDGRLVTFHSFATDLVPGDTNAKADVFIVDRDSDTTRLVSVGTGGIQADGSSTAPEISDDGHTVLFTSVATNLVEGDNNGVKDAFVADLENDSIEMASVSPSGAPGNGVSDTLGSSITPDGRFVAFQSDASNLIPNDTNSDNDVFLRDRATGRTERVNVDSDGIEIAKSNSPSLSDDGRYVAFYSIAPGEDPTSFTWGSDVWLLDRVTRATELISATPFGLPNKYQNENPIVSGDGSYVVFQTDGGEFVPSDSNGAMDIVGRDRGAELEILKAGEKKRSPGVFEGDVTMSGAVLSTASDPAGDSPATPATDITDASLVYRPEQGDLLFRIAVDRMSHLAPAPGPTATVIRGVPGFAVTPGLLHGFRFSFEGQPYEIRFSSVTTDAATDLPKAALFICTTICQKIVSFDAGYGSAGHDMQVSIPSGMFGLEPGESFTNISAISAAGEALVGAGQVFDSVALPDATTPEIFVELGIGSAGEATSSSAIANFHHGRFTGGFAEIPASGTEVWARPCLGAVCGDPISFVVP